MIKGWTSRSAVRFLLASILSFVINIGLTILLHEVWHAPEEMAFAVALAVVHLVNFVTLRFYVYDGQATRAAKQFMIYSGSAIGFRGAEYVAFLVLHSWLRFDYRVVMTGIIMASATLKFFWYWFVFEHLPYSRKTAETAAQPSDFT